MIFFLLLTICSIFISCEDQEGGLYFVNLKKSSDETEEELVLMKLDLKNLEFSESCNFGSDYVDPYKTFHDYENLRTGDGVDAGPYNEYSVFLHDDVTNRNSGVMMRCELETKGVVEAGKYDISCENVFGGGVVDFMCANTMNSTVGTTFYELYKKEVTKEVTIPYYAKEGNEGGTCYYDRTFDQYWCYLFKIGEETGEMYFLDTDLGTRWHHLWLDYVQDFTKVYTIGRVDANTMVGILQYKKHGKLNNGLVQFYFNDTSVNWEQRGSQEVVNGMKDFSSNVITACEVRGTVYFKAIDQKGDIKLIVVDNETGKDQVVDTSTLGDLTYVSQLACI